MILAYLAAINLTAFAAMGWDKEQARQRARRIPENTLLTLALLGGSIGTVAGQQAFRHKNRKQPFAGLLLMIVALQALLTCGAFILI